jgi:hypothetical protein
LDEDCHDQRLRFCGADVAQILASQHREAARAKDFIMKNEDFSTHRKGKREYINDSLTHNLVRNLNEYFKTEAEIPRIRMGKQQKIETLINEETLLLAQYLRNEKRTWVPRIVKFD